MGKPRASYAWFLLKYALRGLFVGLVLFVCIFMLWRVLFSGKLPKEMKTLAVTPELARVYAENGNKLTVFTEKQSTITKTEETYGYFSVPRFVIIEEANEVQVVLRYNNSTLEHTREDFGLAQTPEKGKEVYVVRLTVMTDLTPELTEDNEDGNENILETRLSPVGEVSIATTKLYTYVRYTFRDVPLTDDTIALFFDVFYPADGVDPDTDTAYGTLRIHHRESERTYLTLTAKEKETLAAAGKEGENP